MVSGPMCTIGCRRVVHFSSFLGPLGQRPKIECENTRCRWRSCLSPGAAAPSLGCGAPISRVPPDEVGLEASRAAGSHRRPAEAQVARREAAAGTGRHVPAVPAPPARRRCPGRLPRRPFARCGTDPPEGRQNDGDSHISVGHPAAGRCRALTFQQVVQNHVWQLALRDSSWMFVEAEIALEIVMEMLRSHLFASASWDAGARAMTAQPPLHCSECQPAHPVRPFPTTPAQLPWACVMAQDCWFGQAA